MRDKADNLRPAGAADVPLIQDDLLDYARELLEELDVEAAQRVVADAAELLDEVL